MGTVAGIVLVLLGIILLLVLLKASKRMGNPLDVEGYAMGARVRNGGATTIMFSVVWIIDFALLIGGGYVIWV